MTTPAHPIRVAVIAATGYGGIELLRWLTAHPAVEIVAVSSESSAGQPLTAVYPHLAGLEMALLPAAEARFHGEPQVVFFATPNGTAMQLAPAVLARGGKVIDLSADFRLKDPAVYAAYYGRAHGATDWLARAVYGLPELDREALRGAALVANPGCYPTAALLALAPLLRAGLIAPRGIIIDSKSGVSGAGRTALQTPYLYAEANEDVSAYTVGAHRHQPEIEQQLTAAGGEEAVITFTPHLIPMTRGIFTTAYGPLTRACATDEVLAIYRDAYAGSPFVTVLDATTLPHTKWCAGSNRAFVTARVDARAGRVVALAAIDNLGKGMSGQAVQNMNLLCGLDEATGLERPAVYP
ncbi:MAG TPA: N-acetyl-gamma-glutamyl-phosphate reductase [Armatimonadota bacterium]|nr:N-acetyl-gamma-glutamyl-phosphate reductase [Armatimonadota bacterium]